VAPANPPNASRSIYIGPVTQKLGMTRPILAAILDGSKARKRAKLARLGLSAAEPGYRLAIKLRNLAFDSGLRQATRLPRPAIAIGNLTTGGTGKTPVTLDLARRLLDLGYQPAILLRGYKGTEGDSDEARLYRQAFGYGPTPPAVVADPSRVAGAKQAFAQQPTTDVFLLDDAFQHRQVHRDLNVLLVDATQPFGFGHLLPRGLLREPIAAARRADAVLLTRCDRVDAAALENIEAALARVNPKAVTGRVATHWTGLSDGEHPLPIDRLSDMTIAAACGIGNPGAFEATLRQAAGRLLWCESLGDHAAPPREQIEAMLKHARDHGARAFIITQKDWVNWRGLLTDASRYPLPVYYVCTSVVFHHGEAAFDALIRAIKPATCQSTSRPI